MRKTALLISVILVLFSVQLFAQTSGVLKGQVRDNNGKPISNANVVLQLDGEPTSWGNQTDEDGEYIIINISPGVYDVLFSVAGYKKVIVEGIGINVNQTTTRDAKLSPGDNTLAAVTFTAKKEKIQKDQVGTSRTIEVGTIDEMSVSSVADLVATQAGVTNDGGEIRIRGSRSNEVNFTVDGMSVSDPVDGGSALEVDTDAIADMKVYTGALTAEFGNAQSGMVNVVTKSGSSEYSGKIEANSDHVLGGDDRNMDLIRFSFGGPVLGGIGKSIDLDSKFTFFLNGAGKWQDGGFKDYYESDPTKDFMYQGTNLFLYPNRYTPLDLYSKRENVAGFDLSNRNYNNYNINFKTKYQVTKNANLTLALRGDRSTANAFDWSWKYALQHYAESETNQKQIVLSYDQNLSQKANMKLKFSYFTKDSYQGPKGIDRERTLVQNITSAELTDTTSINAYAREVNLKDANYYDHPAYFSIDRNHDGIYDLGDNFSDYTFWKYNGGVDTYSIPGYQAPGTIYTTFIDDKTSSYNLRGDVEWAINKEHTAKTGFELTKYKIKKNQLGAFSTIYAERRTAYLRSIFDVDVLKSMVAEIPEIGTQAPDGHTWTTDEVNAMWDAVNNKKQQIIDANGDVVTITGDGTENDAFVVIYSPEAYFNAAKASSGSRDGYKAEPFQGAYYIQDKMEWEGMIVTAGLRFDFWYIGDSYDVLQDDGTYLTHKFDGKDKFQLMVSPRVGVSHPISDKDVLRFAYNYQNQLPPMKYIFTSKTVEDALAGDIVTIGNAELKPQITITYEVGLQHLINEDWAADVSVYYKNYYNYPSTKKALLDGQEQVYWYEYISEDYASGRGIELSLDRSLSNFWSSNFSYSFAWAEGNNNSDTPKDNNTNLREFPLNWDVRHNFGANLMFKIDKGEEFFIPFTNWILPIDDISASLSYSYASGAPYTALDPDTGNALDTNGERKDGYQKTNLRITKNISFGRDTKQGLRVFVNFDNLFKNKRIYGVYGKTGDPYDSGNDFTVNGIDIPEVSFMNENYYHNPGNVSNDRTITLGVAYNF